MEAYLPSLYHPEYLAHNKKDEYIFQQDGATAHMSNSTEAWLSKKLPKKINFTARKEWPANSPDLNILENLWSILQDRVIERRAWTEEELCKVVSEEWWKIPQSTIQKLYHGIPERLRRMTANGGGRFDTHNCSP